MIKSVQLSVFGTKAKNLLKIRERKKEKEGQTSASATTAHQICLRNKEINVI